MERLSLIRIFTAVIICGTATAQFSRLEAQEVTPNQLPLGVVRTEPESGRFVKIEGGFMVPYTTTIPGTEIEFTMVPIEGGTFIMGSPEDEEDRRDDEGPQFKVAVEPFWMGKYEVTWGEYKQYMKLDKAFHSLQQRGIRHVTSDSEIDAVTAPSILYKPEFTFGDGNGPNQPAATMSQFAAKQYTKWLSRISDSFYRLPTEAEWEYACRAGTTTAYYFGDDDDDLEDHAWNVETSDDERHPVGQLKPNPWGLYDMYGNVAEWVLDAYDEAGYAEVKSGESVNTRDAFRQPTKIYPRVLRGGSWELEPEGCRSAARIPSDDDEWRIEDPNYPQSPWWFTDSPSTGVGFRLIRPLTPPTTDELKNKFWNADVEEILENAKSRIESNGKGSYGPVDGNLIKDIESLKKK